MVEILTVVKASKYCNVTPKTIVNWVDSGLINAYKTPGGHRRIKLPDLHNFMETQGIPIPEEFIMNDRKKILVVDDDPIIVETIVQALEEDEFDYEVISASDGFEAGIQVSHFKPDVIILDINSIFDYEEKKHDACKEKYTSIAIIDDPSDYDAFKNFGITAWIKRDDLSKLPELLTEVKTRMSL